MLEELLVNESFLRWVKGKSYDQEKGEWDSWLREDPNRERLVYQAKIFLQLPYYSMGQPDIDSELILLHRSIDQHTVVHRLDSYRLAKQTERTHWLYKAATIAAACAVLALVLVYQPNKPAGDKAPRYKTLVTSFGEKALLKLADGTRIYLNAHSTLRYPRVRNVSDPVDIWLDGEAYFDVKRDPNGQRRTFSVYTDEGVVQVLGTRFLVQAWNQRTQVVLEEGSVQVSLKDSIANKEKSLTMRPGELSSFQAKSDTITVRQVNTAVYTSWIDDRIVMDETPLRYLVDRIEHTYGVEVRTENKQILDHKLSGSLKEYNLAILLEGLSQILEVEITHRGESVIIGVN